MSTYAVCLSMKKNDDGSPPRTFDGPILTHLMQIRAHSVRWYEIQGASETQSLRSAVPPRMTRPSSKRSGGGASRGDGAVLRCEICQESTVRRQ
jgi:hypothetical protein